MRFASMLSRSLRTGQTAFLLIGPGTVGKYAHGEMRVPVAPDAHPDAVDAVAVGGAVRIVAGRAAGWLFLWRPDEGPGWAHGTPVCVYGDATIVARGIYHGQQRSAEEGHGVLFRCPAPTVLVGPWGRGPERAVVLHPRIEPYIIRQDQLALTISGAPPEARNVLDAARSMLPAWLVQALDEDEAAEAAVAAMQQAASMASGPASDYEDDPPPVGDPPPSDYRDEAQRPYVAGIGRALVALPIRGGGSRFGVDVATRGDVRVLSGVLHPTQGGVVIASVLPGSDWSIVGTVTRDGRPYRTVTADHAGIDGRPWARSPQE